MSKKIKKDEPIAPDQALSKAEAFVTKHKKAFIIAILAIFAFVGFNAFNEDATEKKENTEAEAAIANIEATWQGMQLQAALDSFLEIIDLYNGTNAANKAHFYAGIIYSQQENYEEAINHLSKYNGSDKIIAPKAKQLLGNCYSQIEDYDNAITTYENALKFTRSRFGENEGCKVITRNMNIVRKEMEEKQQKG